MSSTYTKSTLVYLCFQDINLDTENVDIFADTYTKSVGQDFRLIEEEELGK